MSSPPRQELLADLAREPLRHVELLKQLLAHPRLSTVHRVAGPEGTATLVLLEMAANPWDRQAYPKAALTAVIASDHPALTSALLAEVPRGVGILFKLSTDADRAAVATEFAIEPRASLVSFTAPPGHQCDSDPGVHFSRAPSDAALRLFVEQGYDRETLQTALRDGRAFACVLEQSDEPLSGCLAFENYGTIWEIGAVTTGFVHRRRGFAAAVVRTALAELAARGLQVRYQAEASNTPSTALAHALGLVPFLTLTHHAHGC